MKLMKIYNSFLIRCWLMRNTSQPDRAVFEIEHIQTGERKRAASFAELEGLMLAALPPEISPPQATSRAPTGASGDEGGT